MRTTVHTQDQRTFVIVVAPRRPHQPALNRRSVKTRVIDLFRRHESNRANERIIVRAQTFHRHEATDTEPHFRRTQSGAERQGHRKRDFSSAAARYRLRTLRKTETRNLKRLRDRQRRTRFGAKLRLAEIESASELVLERVKRETTSWRIRSRSEENKFELQ